MNSTRPEEDEVAALLTSREAGGAAIRGGAMRVLGYSVNALLGALAAAFLFRHLGRVRTGTYVTAMSIAAIVAGLSDLGITTVGLRELSTRDARGRARAMSSLLGLRLGLTFIGIIGSVIFAIAVGYSRLLIAAVALAGAGLLFQNLQATLSLSLMSRLRLGLVSVTELARQGSLTALTIALVVLGTGLLVFIGLMIPVGIVLLLVTAWLVRRDVPLIPRFDRDEWRRLARDLLPYSIAIALAAIYFRVSVIVVSLAASPVQLGYFSTSFRIVEVLIMVPTLMVTGVFPIFARSAIDDHARLAYAISRVFVVALIVGVWVALMLAVGAPIAIDAIGGKAFARATGVLRIQGLGLAGTFVIAVWSVTLLSLRRNRQLVLVNLSSLLLGTVLVILLTNAYGARGAAAGTAITEIVLAASVPLLLLRGDSHVLPSMKVVPKVLIAAVLAGLVVLLLNLPAVAAVVIANMVYAVGLLLTRAIPDEVFAELRRALRAARRKLHIP